MKGKFVSLRLKKTHNQNIEHKVRSKDCMEGLTKNYFGPIGVRARPVTMAA